MAARKAKRQTVEVQTIADLPGDEDVSWELVVLPAVYADHPDHLPELRP